MTYFGERTSTAEMLYISFPTIKTHNGHFRHVMLENLMSQITIETGIIEGLLEANFRLNYQPEITFWAKSEMKAMPVRFKGELTTSYGTRELDVTGVRVERQTAKSHLYTIPYRIDIASPVTMTECVTAIAGRSELLTIHMEPYKRIAYFRNR